jgi:hypothetical protein
MTKSSTKKSVTWLENGLLKTEAQQNDSVTSLAIQLRTNRLRSKRSFYKMFGRETVALSRFCHTTETTRIRNVSPQIFNRSTKRMQLLQSLLQ